MAKRKSPPPRSQPRKRSPWDDSPHFVWWVLVVYVLILAVLFRDFIFSDRMFFGSDALSANIYMKTFYLEQLRQGTFPQWSPYLFGGMPFVDAFHSDIFYPVSLPLYFVFDVHRALGWVVIAHIGLAGVAMYAAARTWSVSKPGAALAGLNYMLAPMLVSMVLSGHSGRQFVIAWFPVGFLLLKKIWDHARLRDMALFAGVVGLIILTPHVQMAYFAMWAYAGYSLYRLISEARQTHRLPWRPGAGTLAGVLVAVGVGAIQFYPSYHYVQTYSPRAGPGLDYETAASWSLHPEEVVNAVVPEFSGTTALGENTYWGRSKFKDRLEYCGLVVLLLGLWAAFRSSFRDRWFMLGLAAFGLIFGLGAHTPLFKLFYHTVPLVKSMRAPAMTMFFFLFGFSLLSGVAVDHLKPGTYRNRSSRWRPRWLWGAAAVLLVTALWVSLDPEWAMGAYTRVVYPDLDAQLQNVLLQHTPTIVWSLWWSTLLATGAAILAQVQVRRKVTWTFILFACLILLDLGRMNARFINTIDYDEYFPDDPVVTYLAAQPVPFRVFSASDYVKQEYIPDWAARPAFFSNYFALRGFSEMTGYHGNQLWSYSRLMGGSKHVRASNSDLPRAADLTSVKYLLYLRKANMDGEPADTSLSLVQHQRGVKLYENTDALPYARLVTCWELEDLSDTLFGRLYDTTFDIRHCVLLDQAPEMTPVEDALPAGTATVTQYSVNNVSVDVVANRPALLVLADNNYPAWHATVDQKPVPILTANGTFRAVEVPEGRHSVHFTYQSHRQRLGTLATLFSVSLIFGVLLWDWRARRRH